MQYLRFQPLSELTCNLHTATWSENVSTIKLNGTHFQEKGVLISDWLLEPYDVQRQAHLQQDVLNSVDITLDYD